MNKLSLYFFGLLLGGSLLLVAVIFLPYLNAFILSLVLGILFFPMHRKIRNNIKTPGLAALVSTVVVVLIMLGPVALLTSQLFTEASSLYTQVQNNDLGSASNQLEQKLQGYFPGLNINFENYLQEGLNWLLSHLGGAFSGAFQAFIGILLSIIGLYYWFKNGSELKAALLKLSPMADVHDEEIIKKLNNTVRSVIRGTIIVALIQAFLTGIGFWIFGVPNPVLWGTLAAISALIPGIGTALITTPAIIYLFVTGNVGQAVGLLIWGITAVGLIDNFLGPKLMSQGDRIHPFFILISVIGGIALFGPIGFLAGPLAVSLLFALLDIYLMLIKDKKNLDKHSS